MRISERGLDLLELLRVSWLIAWRYLAMSIVFAVVGLPVLALGLTGVLTTIGVPREAVLTTTQVLGLLLPPLLFYPLIVQMILGKAFEGFEVQAVDSENEPMDLTLMQSAIPGLAIAFGGFLGSLPFFFLLPLMPEALQLSPIAQRAAGELWAALMVYPVLLKVLMQANFGRFRLAVLRYE